MNMKFKPKFESCRLGSNWESVKQSKLQSILRFRLQIGNAAQLQTNGAMMVWLVAAIGSWNWAKDGAMMAGIERADLHKQPFSALRAHQIDGIGPRSTQNLRPRPDWDTDAATDKATSRCKGLWGQGLSSTTSDPRSRASDRIDPTGLERERETERDII